MLKFFDDKSNSANPLLVLKLLVNFFLHGAVLVEVLIQSVHLSGETVNSIQVGLDIWIFFKGLHFRIF